MPVLPASHFYCERIISQELVIILPFLGLFIPKSPVIDKLTVSLCEELQLLITKVEIAKVFRFIVTALTSFDFNTYKKG